MAEEMWSNVWPEWHATGKKMGSGAFGSVYEAIHKDGSVESRAAIKVISVPASENDYYERLTLTQSESKTKASFEEEADAVMKEIDIMQSFKGTANIVNIEDYTKRERSDSFGWDILIRMELLTPFLEYSQGKILPESEVIKLGVDICSALELCAKRNIIHRDIKPENIFINAYGNFKLGDFGVARVFDNTSMSMTRTGTPRYTAPEVDKGFSHYDATADIYSLGLVLYRLVNNGRFPFEPTNDILTPDQRSESDLRRHSGERLPAPCMDYMLEGKFERLTFRATPDIDNNYENFMRSTVVNLIVIDPATDEILFHQQMDSDPHVTEVSVDVSGRNRIQLAVSLESGGNGFVNLGYTFIKDAYLYPTGTYNEGE